MKRKIYKVSKKRAIRIASDHNGVTLDKANNYMDSELREVPHQLKLKAGFLAMNDITETADRLSALLEEQRACIERILQILG